jgi:thiol-disulfide isomerase/thioredoxin
MENIKRIFNKMPGWVYTLVLFGFLYLTGLHTQVIGQVQRLVLATGLLKPKVPELSEATPVIQADDSNAPTAPLPAYPVADYDFTLRTLAGETVTMESLKGKVIFMNLWATWCPPCLAEMPSIQNLYEKVKSDKIAFVMISLDEDPAKAQKFIQRLGFTFPVYTPDGYMPAQFGSGSVIPTTYVISPDGHVVVQKDGMAQYDTREFRDFLRSLSKEAI